MGFSSWSCKGCGRSIRSRYSASGLDDWMEKAVVLFADGSVVKGRYDGYGRLERGDHSEIDFSESDDSGAWWHVACWEHANRPQFNGPSVSAKDQGYFVGAEVNWWPPGMNERRLSDELLTTKREAYLADINQLLKAARAGFTELIETDVLLGFEAWLDTKSINEVIELLDKDQEKSDAEFRERDDTRAAAENSDDN